MLSELALRAMRVFDNESARANDILGIDFSTIEAQIGDHTSRVFKNLDDSTISGICVPCTNLAYALMENEQPIITPYKFTAHQIVHHGSLESLLNCEKTCKVCSFFCRLMRSGPSRDLIKVAPPTPDQKALAEIVVKFKEEVKSALKNDAPKIDDWTKFPYSFISKMMTKREKKRLLRALERLLLEMAQDLASSIENGRRSSRHQDKSYESHMLDLRDVANSLMKKESVLQQNACTFKPVVGYKDQIAEFQLMSLSDQKRGKERFRVFTDPDDPLSQQHLGRPVQRNAGSGQAFIVMQRWISECVNDHPDCALSITLTKQDPMLPTRVIDVCPELEAGRKFTPRLVSLASVRAKWVALSHRWGSGRILTTTTSNLSKMLEGIDFSTLPKTFQDAIDITRSIGIRYLWIDSLCIIQDSDADWLEEAAQMPSIYRNAYVTIAAAATNNSTKGILVDRAWVSKSDPCSMPIPILRTSRSPERRGMIHFDVPFDADMNEQARNYLGDRAWCLQESLLSRRVLTFDQLQMTFTCLKQGRVESRDLPYALARELRNTFLDHFQKIQGHRKFEPEDAELRRLMIRWYEVLWDYTGRNLTMPQDKLVAMSGIANVVGTCIQAQYFAGMWSCDLPSGLLWSPYEEELLPQQPRTATRPSKYRAPSWSWASIDGQISCYLCRAKAPRPPIATIVDIKMILVGPDVYEQISAGCLKIKAPLLHALCGDPLDEWPQQPEAVFDDGDVDDISHVVFDVEILEPGTEIWCLLLTETYGLVLVKKRRPKSGDEVNSRVGNFHLRTRNSKASKVRVPEAHVVTII